MARDFAALGDAAGVGDVRLQHRKRAPGQRVEENPLAHPAFPQVMGTLVRLAIYQHLHPLHRHGFLHKEGAVGGDGFDHLAGDGWVGVVDVHGHVYVRAGPLGAAAETTWCSHSTWEVTSSPFPGPSGP